MSTDPGGLLRARPKEKLGHDACTVAYLCAGSDVHERVFGIPTRGWESGLFPRSIAGVSARGEGSEELPHVYQPVDRQWDGATGRHRAGVRSAVGDGEAIHESVSATGDSRFLPDAAAAVGKCADGRGEAAGAGAVGRGQERTGGEPGDRSGGQHAAQSDSGGTAARGKKKD